MNENVNDGFDSVILESAKNVAEVTIGGTVYKVAPASKRINEGAITEAFAHFKATLPASENDGDEYRPDDKEDAKTTNALSKYYGIRLAKMRDHRIFLKASQYVKEFRALACILNSDGTAYANSAAKISKVLAAFEAKPSIFEQVNAAAGWPEFDRAAKAKKEKKAKEVASKMEVVKEDEGGHDIPNG